MSTTLESVLVLIARINKVLSATAAKDRVIRLIQYLMKFLTHTMSIAGATKARNVELFLIDARKVFRLFRFLENFISLYKIFRARCSVQDRRRTFPLLKSLQLIQQGGLFSFFISDHVLLLSKLSIIPYDPVFLRQVFGGMWLVSCVSGAGADIIRLNDLYSHDINKKVNLNEELVLSVGLAEDERHAAKVENAMDLVLNLLNGFVAVNLSKKDMPYNRGVVGACGMITSGIQLWQIYQTHMLGRELGARLQVPIEEISDDED